MHEPNITYRWNNIFKRKNTKKKGGGRKKENLSKSFLPICIKLNIIVFYILKFFVHNSNFQKLKSEEIVCKPFETE